jgi:hypothetical protein
VCFKQHSRWYLTQATAWVKSSLPPNAHLGLGKKHDELITVFLPEAGSKSLTQVISKPNWIRSPTVAAGYTLGMRASTLGYRT